MDKETNRNNKTEDVLIDVVVFENSEIVIKSMILNELVTDVHYEVNSEHAIFLTDMIYDISAGVFELMIADQTIDGVDIDVANDNLIKMIKENIKSFVSLMAKKYVELETVTGEFLLDLIEKGEKQERIDKAYSDERKTVETPITEEIVDEQDKKQTAKRTKPIEKYFLST
jgi:hypothetical protein